MWQSSLQYLIRSPFKDTMKYIAGNMCYFLNNWSWSSSCIVLQLYCLKNKQLNGIPNQHALWSEGRVLQQENRVFNMILQERMNFKALFCGYVVRMKHKHLIIQGVPEKTFFQNLPRFAQNCPELPKLPRMPIFAQICPRFAPIVQICPKIAQNCPD